MLNYPDIDPVALAVGPIKVHWYGVMYLVAFTAAWWLGRRRMADSRRGFQVAEMDDLLFFCALGIIIGGRFGHVLFYDFSHFLNNPMSVFFIWQGGMSFHGGLLGVLLAMAWYARKTTRPFFAVADLVAPLVPPGLAAGRLGNFINGELWGRPTDIPWAMVFPRAGDGIARHPSQLYEFALEGLLLFGLLWWYSSRPRPLMVVSALFLLGYGSFRFLVEFVREPDVGFVALGWVSMGQLLSAPMIVFGAALLVFSHRAAVSRGAT